MTKAKDEEDLKEGLAQVFKTYEVPSIQRARVRRYLRRHPQLVPALLEAPPMVYRAFGDDVGLALRVTTDPEDGRNFLWVIIIMDGRRDAVKRMDRLLRVWVEKEPLEVRRLMGFTRRTSRAWIHLAKVP